MAKRQKVDKKTRQLMQSITDLVKKKGAGYRFKTKKKKVIKRVKTTCPHWIIRKGKEVPTVTVDPKNSNNWVCTVCGASFPIRPEDIDVYEKHIEKTIEYVNQMQFWSVKLGGDADDTEMFIKLKSQLERFGKASKQIIKQANKRDAIERNKERIGNMNQLDMYAYNYRS